MFGKIISSVGDRLIALGKQVKKASRILQPPVEIAIRERKHRGKIAHFGVGVDHDGNKIDVYLSRDPAKAERKAKDLSAELSGFL